MTDPFGEFIGGVVGELKAKAADLNAYGATGIGQACAKIATELEADYQAWWLAGLTVREAARESGLSEDWLRSMVREDKLPAKRENGGIRIARCHLPHRSTPEPQASSIADRLLRKDPGGGLLRPAS